MSLMPTGDEAHFQDMQKVIDLYVKNVKPTEIARETGLKRKDVLDLIDEWKKTAVGSEIMQERMEELIVTMDEHFSGLIGGLYEIVEAVDDTLQSADVKNTAALLGQKKAAIDSIGNLEEKRLNLLDKMGLRYDAAVGDELIEQQEYITFLESVIDETICDADRTKIQERIREYKQTGAVIVIHD